MKNPAVTVLIDTYNHERFIEQAIVSALEQDFPSADVEILVIDDGSTDRTPEIVRKFEPRVRLIRKPNGGQASAFNAGIPEARGEIIAFLDGDDWWAPNKLTRVAETLAADSSLGIVGHGIVVMRPGDNAESISLRDGHAFQANTLEGAALFGVRRAFLGTSRMTIRASLVRAIGAIPESIRIEADEYLFTLAAVLARVRILPEALTYYRLHDANAYQIEQQDKGRARRKQESIAALAHELREQLIRRDVPPDVQRKITSVVQAEADQLRLFLGEGWPWETAKTEWTLYRSLHPDASTLHRIFKTISLVPAFTLPPRFFYEARSKLITSDFYLRARKRWLPMPQLAHIERSSRAGP
ncbi:MAG: glycosyltransferase family 2 protein [Candidatus Acidiferrales bacterium]